MTEWWQPGDGDKADIADVVVRMLNGKRIYKTAAEVMEDLPLLKKLDDKCNFELMDGDQETKEPNNNDRQPEE